MDLGKKEGIVVVGEIQKGEIMPLTLELIGAAGKLSKERNLSLSVILSGCEIKEEAKKLTITELMKSFVLKMKN